MRVLIADDHLSFTEVVPRDADVAHELQGVNRHEARHPGAKFFLEAEGQREMVRHDRREQEREDAGHRSLGETPAAP